MDFPRIIIAALRGGSGKTILSIGIIAALSKLGQSIAPFKKGPDYIDAGWLALAAGRPCYNLDSFLLSAEENLRSFRSHSIDCDICVIEGNRGLYDGIDLAGSTSTAELAKLLACPVVLCVDCTKITRTMAAVVSGCSQFDPDVMIKGVILNRVAGLRHEKKLRDSIEHYCGIAVLGAIPKLDQQHFPERHLGLVPTPEHAWAKNSIDAVTRIAERHIDLGAIVAIAQNAPAMKTEERRQRTEHGGQKAEDRRQKTEDRGQRTDGRRKRTDDRGQRSEGGWRMAEFRDDKPVASDQEPATITQPPAPRDPYPETISQRPESRYRRPELTIEPPLPRIGIIRDSAFQFYYPENIDALTAEGAEIVFVSPLKDQKLPGLDALYIGGGFPETHGQQLSANQRFNEQLKALAEEGFPIYAECGGLMYLAEKLVVEEKSYPMVGILPLAFDFYKRPQGHGYTIITVEGQNPYYDVGAEIRGHEFHYSRVSEWTGDKNNLVFRMKRGVGIDKDRDGILYKNVLATYTHVHARGTPEWAKALVRNAIKFQNTRA